MRLNDKVAIVTGASSDIGRGIVKRFTEEGAKVILKKYTAYIKRHRIKHNVVVEIWNDCLWVNKKTWEN